MPPFFRLVTTISVAALLLGSLGTARGQGPTRAPLSPEVMVDHRIVLRLQAPSIVAVRFSGAPPGGYLVCYEVRLTPLPDLAK